MVTERKKPSYDLADIKHSMSSVEKINIVATARKNLTNLGFTVNDLLKIIQQLTMNDFYKSMTTYENHRVWQDVYKPIYNDIEVYMKIQKVSVFFVVSFKEK